MKTVAILIAAAALAAPLALTLSSPADAQVMAGRGGDTRRLHDAPRPALSPREEDRLFAAEDAVTELQGQIDALEEVTEPTADQSSSLDDLRDRLRREQGTVDRLTRKRDRRG